MYGTARAGDVLLLPGRTDASVHHAHSDVLYIGSPRFPVWSIPPPVRAADYADLYGSDRHNDTDVLLHEPRLLLHTDNLLHGPGGDCTLGHVC